MVGCGWNRRHMSRACVRHMGLTLRADLLVGRSYRAAFRRSDPLSLDRVFLGQGLRGCVLLRHPIVRRCACRG